MFLKEKKKPIKLKLDFQITVAIVVYEENFNILKKTVDCFLSLPFQKRLFLIDNSSTNILENKFNHPEIEYIFSGKNLGFGKAHNKVIDSIRNKSRYHLILNPDVTFLPKVITDLIDEINKHNDIAMIGPKVVFPNGEHQYSCRRYPTVLDLLARVLKFPKKVIERGEYKDFDLSKSFYPDFLQGCFQLFRTEDFIEIGGFDERYFLYMEDVDICRKIDQSGKKKYYYPNVQIKHELRKGSSNNIQLFFMHLNSSIKYFKKWGF